LEKLDIKGWRTVSEEALNAIGTSCPNLKQLNVGWCRMLTDFTMKAILDGCEQIETVKAWGELALMSFDDRGSISADPHHRTYPGCNKLTDNVPRKKGCRVTGIEAHAIGV
jgi:DNA repair protein RAD7